MSIFGNGSGSKFFNRLFRHVDGLVWEITTGKVGIRTSEGIYTFESTTTGTGAESTVEYGVSVNPFDNFGFPIPAFATQTALSDVKIGDLIIGERDVLGWVKEVRGASLQLLDSKGMTKNYTPPKVQVLNQGGCMVVRSMTTLLGDTGANNLQGLLLPLLMAGEDLDLQSILPMLLFSQQNQNDATNNPLMSMLPMLLMSKKSGGGGAGGIDPMMLMMMSGGMGGGAGGMNPMMMMALLGDSFGGSGAADPVVVGTPALRHVNVPTLTPTRRR